MKTSKIKHFCLGGALAGALLPGCGEDEASGEGIWGLRIYGEPFIEEGIPASAFTDGWAVRFDHFYVVVSGLKAPGVTFDGAYVFDLARPSGGAGHPITEAMIAAGHHPTLGYAIRPVSAATPANVDAPVAEALVAGGFSMQVEGEATRGDEARRFAWRFATATTYTACETDQHLADGGRIESQLTVHADHLFYDDLDSAEPGLAFDLIAGADADGDGLVTEVELAAVDLATQERYQVGSRPITDLWRFIEQQATTVGHIDGEGHCAAE